MRRKPLRDVFRMPTACSQCVGGNCDVHCSPPSSRLCSESEGSQSIMVGRLKRTAAHMALTLSEPVKAHSAEPDDLGSIFRTYVVEGETPIPEVILWPLQSRCGTVPLPIRKGTGTAGFSSGSVSSSSGPPASEAEVRCSLRLLPRSGRRGASRNGGRAGMAAAAAGPGAWAAQEKQFPPALLSFFIYNPRFGPREGEEENKILFYHPNEVEKNEKIRNVGLCEAIVQFTRTFSPSKPAKSLHTQKNRQFFNEPEENFWMVMVVRNPIIEKQSKDGKAVVEYQEEELLDKVYSSVLQQCYSMYKLFNGTFLKAMEDGGVKLLKERLEKFFHRYLQTLHLQSCDLLDIFGGISFFPLDKMTYLKIQSFINRMEESLSIVKYTAFLYNDQLIWSGLEQDDMRILYKYLTTSLFPRHIEPELAGRDSPVRAEMPGNLQHYGRFLTGPLNLNDPEAKCRFPKIFVNTDDTYEELHLIVYKAMSAAVCFMIDASTPLTLDFCRRLDSIVGPQLTVLASDICEQFNINKRISGSEKEPQFKFIYFNHMNLAEKSTIHMRKTPSVSLTSVHPDLMKILGDINSDFTRADEDEEIIVKAMSDYWVVGKKSDQRELYVILNQKNANLIEVNEEVKKLCATQFNNIFFLD